MFKTIIFDLDGTLLYTLEDLCCSTNFALAKFNCRERSLEEIKNFVGDGVKKLIERAAPELDQNQTSKCLEIFKEHYQDNMFNKTRPYPFIYETLKRLKKENITIGVVSNKFDTAVKKICKYYFDSLIDYAIGQKKSISPKPSPVGVLEIIKKLNIYNLNEILFVGDSSTDIQTAKNAHIQCAAVTWGYRPESELIKEGADYIVHNPLELLEIIF